MIKGQIHSIQSLGTVDGPGIRFVVFMQGCPFRCSCCHNPDTWDFNGGKEVSVEEIIEKLHRCRGYFGEKGGLTVSGGEPLCQAEFVANLFSAAKANGINTCLDTAGLPLTGDVEKVLSLSDRVLLDVKFSNGEQYDRHVGASLSATLEFLDRLSELSIPTTLRRVIIPGLNDTEADTLWLKALAESHKNVDGVELLPFRKLCAPKYEALGIEFPLADTETPSTEKMDGLKALLLG